MNPPNNCHCEDFKSPLIRGLLTPRLQQILVHRSFNEGGGFRGVLFAKQSHFRNFHFRDFAFQVFSLFFSARICLTFPHFFVNLYHKMKKETKTIATNRKARYLYHIDSTYEVGIVLVGCEVKSVKASKISLTDSYARLEDSEVFLYNMHITPYEKKDGFAHHNPRRKRKLLLKKQEIRKLTVKVQERGYTLIPLRVFISDRGLVKLELGLAKGKRKFEKREAIKEREIKRELEHIQKGMKR